VAQLRTNHLDFRDDLVQDPGSGFLSLDPEPYPYSDPNSGTFDDNLGGAARHKERLLHFGAIWVRIWIPSSKMQTQKNFW